MIDGVYSVNSKIYIEKEIKYYCNSQYIICNVLTICMLLAYGHTALLAVCVLCPRIVSQRILQPPYPHHPLSLSHSLSL